MTDEELTQAMAELQEVVRCRCDEAYRDRGLKDPHCECDSADAVKVVADRIKALEAKLTKAEEVLRDLTKAFTEKVDVEQVVADRIEALTEQLTAAQRDAKEAEAYAEELEKERDDYALKLMQAYNTYTEMHLDIERLSDKLATCEKYRDAYAGCDRIGTQAVRDLEAKLAKAVEALQWCAMYGDGDVALATLAEIKGESHD